VTVNPVTSSVCEKGQTDPLTHVPACPLSKALIKLSFLLISVSS